MSPLRSLRDELTDERSRTAVLVGLASIPFTVALSRESLPETGSPTPVFVAGLIVGYLYADREMESSRAGKLVGLVGGVPVVIWSVLRFVTELVSYVASTAQWPIGILLVLVPIGATVGVAIFVLVAVVGARTGEWVAGRVSPGPQDLTERDVRDSRRWRYVAAYLLAAPLVLGTWVVLDSGAGAAIGIFAWVSLLVLAAVGYLALCKDAIAFRRVDAIRLPIVWLYLGLPVGAYVLVYQVAEIRESTAPSVYGWFGFLAALWIASLAYLGTRRRRVGAP